MPRIQKKNQAQTADGTHEMVTLLRPGAAPSSGHRVSAFPADLFEQARGRLRLLAGFFVVAFLFDVLIFVGVTAFNRALPPVHALLAPEIALAGVILSVSVWWAAKSARISAPRIHTVGLVYEVLVCAIASISTYWQYYRETGLIPNLTWVPAIVIMFPLIMPGPPRRMLLAAIASGATGPLALAVLELTGKIDTKGGNGYVQAIV